MKICASSLLVIVLFNLMPLTAQESEQTIEELYLKGAIKTQIIKAEAASFDRDMKMIALKDIEEMIAEGLTNNNIDIAPILGGLAGEGITNIIREEGHIINNFPEIRREATRLLGQLGTQEAVDELRTVLLTDREPMVMSEAMLAISNIPVTDTNTRDRTLAEAIYRQTAVNKDNNFAFAYLQAVENIVTREGVIKNPMIIEEIAKIADARQGYTTKVQKRAIEILQRLKNF